MNISRERNRRTKLKPSLTIKRSDCPIAANVWLTLNPAALSSWRLETKNEASRLIISPIIPSLPAVELRADPKSLMPVFILFVIAPNILCVLSARFICDSCASTISFCDFRVFRRNSKLVLSCSVNFGPNTLVCKVIRSANSLSFASISSPSCSDKPASVCRSVSAVTCSVIDRRVDAPRSAILVTTSNLDCISRLASSVRERSKADSRRVTLLIF